MRTRLPMTRESLGALVLAFGIPFLFVNEDQFGLEVGSTTVNLGPADAAVVAILLAAVGTGSRVGTTHLGAARALWVPGIALVVWLAFATFRPVSLDDARFDDHFAQFIELVAYASLAVAVPLLVRRAQDLTLVASSFVLSALVVSTVALVRFGADVLDIGPHDWQQPSFIGHNDLAALVGIAIGVAAAGILCTRSRIPAPQLFAVALAAGGVGLLLAGSTAVAGFALGALVIAFAARRRFAPSGRRVLALGAVVAALLAGVTVLRAEGLARVGELTGLGAHRAPSGVETYSEQALLAYIGLRIFEDNPITGVGWQRSARAEVVQPYLADARRHFPDEIEEGFTAPEQGLGIRNLYVQMLADAGAIGFVLLLATAAGGLVLCWRTAAYASNPWAAGAGLAVLCALLTLAGAWAVVGIVPGIPLDAATSLLLGLAAAGAATVEEETGARASAGKAPLG